MRTRLYWTYDVDVAELVQPEVVRSTGRVHEVAVGKLLVDLIHSLVELVQNPFLDEAFVASGLPDTVISTKTLASLHLARVFLQNAPWA